MAIETTYRTDAEEMMDDFSLSNEALITALKDLSRINLLLGGNNVTRNGVSQLLKNIPRDREITIMDFGCGGGDLLRMLADFGQKNNRKFRLIGVDANETAIQFAREHSVAYPNIEFITADIFKTDFKGFQPDIALLTLTLHHFKDPDIKEILHILYEDVSLGIVVNDLQRSKLAYRLFQAVIFVFRLEPMTAQDGLISILRGFKRKDLVLFSEQLNFTKCRIRWKWAFRWQWIIHKL